MTPAAICRAMPAFAAALAALPMIVSPLGCEAQTTDRNSGIEAFRRGLELHAEGRDSAALEAYRDARAQLQVVDGWVALYSAEAAAELGDTTAVREYLASVSDPALGRGWGWRHGVRARLMAGDTAAAILAGRAAAAELTDTDHRAESRYRVAQLLLASGDSAAARELLQSIMDEAPYALAAVHAALVLTGMPELTAEDHLRIGRTYLRHGNAARGREGIEAYLGAVDVPAAERTALRFDIGRALYRAGDYAEAETVLLDLVASERLPEAEAAEALFLAGRAQHRLGRAAEGRASFARTGERYAGTQAATEALFLAGDLNHDTGRLDSARHYYRRTIENQPASYHAGLATMRLSGMSFLAGDYEEAASILETYRQRFPDGRRYLKATYWSARAYDALGDTARARTRLRSLRARDPLSYYGLLAADRLDTEFFDVSLEPSPPAAPDRASAAAEAVEPVVVLRDVGVDSARVYEMDRVLDSYRDDRSAELSSLYALAETLIAERFTYQGIMLGWRIHDRVEDWNERLLRIIYPFPYERAVREAARAHGLDPYLVAGLIRQESMFNADVYSSAGAVGLMQIMPTTGRMLARATEIGVFDTAMLERPELNIRLGTRYLDEMLERFDGNLTAVLAAYNAGPYQVGQWMDLPEFDREELFAERIPYRETRDYVKAVQRNARLYEALYGDGVNAAASAGR